jgi:hypothetical protein
MREWIPPRGSKVFFSIEAIDWPLGAARTSGALRRRQLYEQFGLKWSEYEHSKLALDDPRWPALLDELAELKTKQVLQLQACWIEEPLVKASDPTAWFELSTGSAEFRSPAKSPPSMHVGWRDGVYYASDRFRKVVGAAGLTGLGWLPMKHARGDEPMPWYEVYAERPIGRGLDHPLLDASKYDAEQAKYKFDPARRWGQAVAWGRDFRSDTQLKDPIFRRLKEVAPEQYFRVAGPKRFCREYLPETDFAYEGWGYKRDKNGPGYESRPVRTICCNAKARGVLINAGVMKPSRFDPVATVPADHADSEILDRIVLHPLPLPAYTPHEAAAERSTREASMVKPARPRTMFATIDEAIASLESRLHDGSATWTPARDTPEFLEIIKSGLHARVPENWRRIAALLPLSIPEQDHDDATADESPLEFEMCPPAWNDWLGTDEDEREAEQPSGEDLVIGRTPTGDWFALRMGDPLLPADARIVHWDHETTSIAEEWPTVAAFAAEIIDTCDRRSQP